MIDLEYTGTVKQKREREFVDRQDKKVIFYQVKFEDLPNIAFSISESDYNAISEGADVDGYIQLSEATRAVAGKKEGDDPWVAHYLKYRFKLEE